MTQSFVIDASVTAAAFLDDEPSYPLAAELLDAARRGDVALIAPDHLAIETAAAIAKAARRRRIEIPVAAALIPQVPEMAVQLRSSIPLIARAAEICLATALGLYDCLFIALAEHLGLPLVTSDDRQAAFASQFAPVLDLRAALESAPRDA